MVRYVYIIFDHATDEFYIGSRLWHEGDDPKKDTTYMGSGTYWDEAPESCEKYIIKKGFKTKKEKHQYENKLINQYFNHPKNVNRNDPKKGFYFDNSGKNHPNYGKTLKAEIRRKISEAHKGKTLTEEHKRKLSEAHKGKTHTAETRRKMSETRKGKNSPNSKAIFHLVTGKSYDTITQASKETGESRPNISEHCLGKKCKNNPRWKYADEVVSKKSYYVEEGIEHIKSGKKFPTQSKAAKAFDCSRYKIYSHCNNKVKNPKFKYYKEKIYWKDSDKN